MDRPNAPSQLSLLSLPPPVSFPMPSGSTPPSPTSLSMPYVPLKSPSFYKPRRAYTPPLSRRWMAGLAALANLALLGLVGMMVYFFVFPTLGGEVRRVGADAVGGLEVVNIEEYTHLNVHHHYHPHYPSSSPSRYTAVKLTQQEKLAALVSFILSPLHSNSLPSLPPSQVDEVDFADLVEFRLDGGDRSKLMVEEMVRSVWDDEKVVVFGLRHQTHAVMHLLHTWKLPRPSTIDLDQRADGPLMEALVRDLTSSSESQWSLPLLLIRGTPIIGMDNIKALGESGDLLQLLEGIQLNDA